MGLRCILGHDFGETQTEREREERGDEVVETVTEVRECSRCGQREVVSESTEVTPLDTAAGGTGTSGDTTDAAGPAPGGAGADRPASTGRSGATTDPETGHDPTPSDPAEPTDAVPESDVDVVIDEESEPDPEPEDDAEIIDAEAEPDVSGGDAGDGGDRDPRAWPDADHTHPAEADGERVGTDEWPDHDGRGGSVGADDGASVAMGETIEREPSVDRAGTAPEEDVEFVDADDDPTPETANGTSDVIEPTETVDPEVDLSAPARETEREYFCPDCGHAETVGASSMRKGDICPDCLRGYIDERPVE